MAKQSDAGYYAIIPAEVRYSKEISANAKLLYGEITALAQKEGYCWASNKYFADLYDVNTNTVSKWVNELVKAGFVSVLIEQGVSRKISIGITKKREGGHEKAEGGYHEKAEHNTTRDKNTSNTTKNIPDECYTLAELLKEKILERYPNNKIASNYRDNWAKEIDLMVRRDNRTYEQIKGAILWAFDVNDFWHRQIWSGSNLRKHFDKMLAQAQADMPRLRRQEKDKLDHLLARDKITVQEYREKVARLGN